MASLRGILQTRKPFAPSSTTTFTITASFKRRILRLIALEPLVTPRQGIKNELPMVNSGQFKA